MKKIDLKQLMTAQSIGLNPELYSQAISFLFDRPVPIENQPEWYWSDEAEFDATPLEWTRILTLLFQNSGVDLEKFNDEQIGMGLNYIMSNAVSHVPFHPTDATVPLAEAMRMTEVFPLLWRDCISPRTKHVHLPIGTSTDVLGYVCYMWFDVTPMFRLASAVPAWKDALQKTLLAMLELPSREVVIAALHGIGYHIDDLDAKQTASQVLNCLKRMDPKDQELIEYARCALKGNVQ